MAELERQIEALQHVLERRGDVRAAWLFGSLADGRARPDSDADVAILLDHRMTSEDRRELIESIAKVVRRAVDVVDLYDGPEPVLGEALRGRRVHGGAEVYANLLSRHVVNQADFVPLRERILDERRRRWLA